jgi:hypothetical protein
LLSGEIINNIIVMGIFNNESHLDRKIANIKKDFENIISEICSEKFDIFHYGAADINPKHLVYWICVDSDNIKHVLSNDTVLNDQLRNVLALHNYPQEAINEVHIGFESQETVVRESNGNWYVHFK